MSKITTTCDECKKLLREAEARYTIGEYPSKRLCDKCFYFWLEGEELNDD